ncbi:MAG: sulfite reductase subunit alpha [Acetobacteraceae bacterium]
MNAISAPLPLIPENAPFSAQQRAWLNGFLAGLYGGTQQAGMSQATPPPEEFPWHDPALELAERLSLADGKPLPRRLMAAMAQLDCGQCGYLCQTYAEALAEGREASTALCIPGAKETTKALKALLAEAPAAAPASVPAAVARPLGKPVRVVSAEALTRPGSGKDVRHVVIDLAGSGLTYEPGDSLGIAARNDPMLVDACLKALGCTGAEPVPCPDGAERPLSEALLSHLDIARPLDRALELLAMAATHPKHARALRRLADGEDGAEPADADLLDLLAAFPSARPPVADLARALPALKPRLYSIASSPRASPGQAHLCVSVVRDERRARVRHRVASGFLADRAVPHGDVLAHAQASHFRLPADPATPIIMVGPGTGIAPFRAFLQHRAAAGVRGRTWLFFGDRARATDFLYEDELNAWRRDGTLARLDGAFSRDQGKKIYVQHRMEEQATDLWRWLQDGAHFYVCGDATRMARDVDQTLRRVAMAEGGMSESQARDWIVALARQGRYLRDIY